MMKFPPYKNYTITFYSRGIFKAPVTTTDIFINSNTEKKQYY